MRPRIYMGGGVSEGVLGYPGRGGGGGGGNQTDPLNL